MTSDFRTYEAGEPANIPVKTIHHGPPLDPPDSDDVDLPELMATSNAVAQADVNLQYLAGYTLSELAKGDTSAAQHVMGVDPTTTLKLVALIASVVQGCAEDRLKAALTKSANRPNGVFAHRMAAKLAWKLPDEWGQSRQAMAAALVATGHAAVADPEIWERAFPVRAR